MLPLIFGLLCFVVIVIVVDMKNVYVEVKSVEIGYSLVDIVLEKWILGLFYVKVHLCYCSLDHCIISL